jgi:hypothetical protein
MRQKKTKLMIAGVAFLAISGILIQAQEPEEELKVEHANCSFFGAKQGEHARSGLAAQARKDYEFSRLTSEVVSRIAPQSIKGERFNTESTNVIDQQLRKAWEDAGATPAAKTNDYEFLRRVTLDLTGRIPSADTVERFVADTDPEKRSKMVDTLLASPEFTDKWTMFFGDLLKNTLRTTQVVRYAEGRTAFYQWIKDSVAANKTYDKMATELITATTTNSYEKGEANWVVGGFVTGGPVQDVMDQSAMNVAETFLGVGHMNCVMCHDGRRHLDTLSLWGKGATRYSAYQFAAFFSQTALARVRVGTAATPYYWTVQDTRRNNYQLNTTTGNRPPRSTVGTVRVVTPEYPFSAVAPAAGENYRVVLAREVTKDFQFSRAAVNHLWKQFMTKAFVEPVNQFDPARLDPDNPPEAPWTLQPNQPRLLKALAQHFIDNKFDIRALMRTIVTSEAYQLSSRYEGEWNPAWENLYARHMPRRLWAEEVHDAVVTASKLPTSYAVRDLGTVNWAMQLPDVVGMPGGAVNSWLDSFYRGNRDTEDRRGEGSTLQALNLMNDNFVMSRTRASGTVEAGSLLRRSLTQGSNEQLARTLFLNVLSRQPNSEELAAATTALSSGNRQQKAEDLLWSLYNKVDFIFNY